MTVSKTISNSGYVGYSLATKYFGLTITSAGAIAGTVGATATKYSVTGGHGGVALTVDHTAVVGNNGTITGGAGGDGSATYPGHNGGAGGVGVLITGAGVKLNNTASISGGAGGDGAGASGQGGPGGAGVSLAAAGTVVNSGLIAGGAAGIGVYQGVDGYGVILDAGGTVTNTGSIAGYVGVDGKSGGAATVTNKATITAGVAGVALYGAGSTLYNSAAGTIYGIYGAVRMGAAGTVTNYGSITEAAISSIGAVEAYKVSGTVTVANYGYLKGQFGVRIHGAGSAGSVGNSGTISAITDAVYVYAGTVTNKGTLTADIAGVAGNALTVVNQAGGHIMGSFGISLSGAGTVTNLGSMTTGYGTGVYLGAGGAATNGSVTNATAAIGGFSDIHAHLAATITNYGSLIATHYGTAVRLDAGGTVVNQIGGTIAGGDRGVYAGGVATVVNYGSIGGSGYGVRFNSYKSRMIVGAGSSVFGVIYGAGGTLEIGGGGTAGSAGTIGNLGGPLGGQLSGGASAQFSHFNSYVIDARASWVLASGTLNSGHTLIDAGTLTVSSYVTNDGSVFGAGGANAVTPGGGGTGVDALHGAAAARLTNLRGIYGGAGGGGVGGAALLGFAGGAGGVGVSLASGGSIANYQMIVGGQGGGAGSYAYGLPGGTGGAGGAGGAGVIGSTINNSGVIHGGAGGHGGSGSSVSGMGGAGGAGVTVLAQGSLINHLLIYGGTGGSGGAPGSQGVGVFLETGSHFTNGALFAPATAIGGVGVYAKADATVINYGTIAGANEGGKWVSVQLTSADDVLVAWWGSQFVGSIVGGGGTLDVMGPGGTVSGLGGYGTLSGSMSAQFGGFGTYDFEPNGFWTTSGPNKLGAGQTLVNQGYLTVGGASYLSIDTGKTSTNDGTILAQTLVEVVSSTLQNGATGLVRAGLFGEVRLDGGRILGGSVSIAANGELDTVNHASFINGGAAVANAGLIQIGDGANLTLAGSLANSGTIAVMGTTHWTALVADTSGLTLSGGGEVSLTARSQIMGAVLDNVDNTIVGAGIVHTGLVLTNGPAGVIDATTGRMTLATHNTVTNHGLIESTGKGGLLIQASTIDGSAGGRIEDGHSLMLDNATLSFGALTIDHGAVLTALNHAGTISLGAATVMNAGVVEGAAGGLTINGDVANNGILEAVNGNLTITGAVTGTGNVRVIGSGTLEIDGALGENAVFTAASKGALVLDDPTGFTGKVYGFSKTGANTIDLKNITFDAGDTVSYKGSAAGGILSVLDASKHAIATIKLAGDYRNSTFTLSDGGVDGTVISDPPKTTTLTSAIAAFGAASGSTATAQAHAQPPLSQLAAPH